MERQLPELVSLKEPCYEMEGQLTELPQEEYKQQAEGMSEELEEAEGISDGLTDEQYSVLLAMTEKAISLIERNINRINEETAHMAQMRLIPPNQKCDRASSHSNISEAILTGDSKYEDSTPKPSLECQLVYAQQNKEEPRTSFREKEQQEIPEMQQLELELELETKPRLWSLKEQLSGRGSLPKELELGQQRLGRDSGTEGLRRIQLGNLQGELQQKEVGLPRKFLWGGSLKEQEQQQLMGQPGVHSTENLREQCRYDSEKMSQLLMQEQTNRVFHQMQRLEREVNVDVRNTLILEQQLPWRSYKPQTEHTQQWETCYWERCLEQKPSVHQSTLKLEKWLSFWVSLPTSKMSIFNPRFICLIDGDTYRNSGDYLLSRKRRRPIGVT
jgi:hypothetical protein